MSTQTSELKQELLPKVRLLTEVALNEFDSKRMEIEENDSGALIKIHTLMYIKVILSLIHHFKSISLFEILKLFEFVPEQFKTEWMIDFLKQRDDHVDYLLSDDKNKSYKQKIEKETLEQIEYINFLEIEKNAKQISEKFGKSPGFIKLSLFIKMGRQSRNVLSYEKEYDEKINNVKHQFDIVSEYMYKTKELEKIFNENRKDFENFKKKYIDPFEEKSLKIQFHVTERKIRLVELIFIEKLSFVPTRYTRKILYEISEKAITNPRLCRKRSPFPELHKDNSTQKLMIDPSKSILVRIANRSNAIIKDDNFAILEDVNPPFLPIKDKNGKIIGGSNGPNGVLINFDGENKRRINLFYKNEKTTKKLLNAYIKFRNKNKKKIFKLMINQMKRVKNPSDSYKTLIDIFEKVELLSNEEFDQTIGIVSFCQTWNSNNEDIFSPEFSVESPHFQTRFYLKTIKYIDVDVEQIYLYLKYMKSFINAMIKLGYLKKFVILDVLQIEFYDIIKKVDKTPYFDY